LIEALELRGKILTKLRRTKEAEECFIEGAKLKQQTASRNGEGN
jgi:hypothetical protein